MVLKETMDVSIDHTFLNCRFVKIFVNNVIDWFKAAATLNLFQQLKMLVHRMVTPALYSPEHICTLRW